MTKAYLNYIILNYLINSSTHKQQHLKCCVCNGFPILIVTQCYSNTFKYLFKILYKSLIFYIRKDLN